MSDSGYKGYREEELEYQYNPRVTVAEYPELAAKRGEASRKVRATHKSWLDVPYGRSARQKLDIFPAQTDGTPVLLYLHGGYWRGGSKEENCNFVPAFSARGANVVVIEYDLCPAVSVTDIVAQARSAIAWTFRNIAQYGGDASKLYLAGHSAGAHLGAMALTYDWEKDGLPKDCIKGAVLSSGVYDLDMVMRVSVNDEIRMNPDTARANSPFLHPPRADCPVLIAVGGAEPEGWRAMSKDYFEFCRGRGVDCEYLEVSAANHYTMSDHLADPASPLARAAFTLMRI